MVAKESVRCVGGGGVEGWRPIRCEESSDKHGLWSFVVNVYGVGTMTCLKQESCIIDTCP